MGKVLGLDTCICCYNLPKSIPTFVFLSLLVYPQNKRITHPIWCGGPRLKGSYSYHVTGVGPTIPKWIIWYIKEILNVLVLVDGYGRDKFELEHRSQDRCRSKNLSFIKCNFLKLRLLRMNLDYAS